MHKGKKCVLNAPPKGKKKKKNREHDEACEMQA